MTEVVETSTKCPECGNTENFEIVDSKWMRTQKGDEVIEQLEEKVKCDICGTLIKAVYRLELWEKWESE